MTSATPTNTAPLAPFHDRRLRADGETPDVPLVSRRLVDVPPDVAHRAPDLQAALLGTVEGQVVGLWLH